MRRSGHVLASRWIGTAAVIAAMSACADGGAPEGETGAPPEPPPAGGATAGDETGPAGVGRLDGAFAETAREFDVPAEILKAVAYAETRWNMVEGHEEFEGVAPAHGVMALRGDSLRRGAELAGVGTEAARSEPLANVRAAAALLDAHARDIGVDRDGDLGAWGPAVARFGAIADDTARRQYVRGVYRILREGVVVETGDGEVVATLLPTDAAPEMPGAARAAAAAAGPDFGGSVWRPSPNHNSRPGGARGDVSMVIVHTCEGSYAGCWSWLRNTQAGASAHYVVSESGHEITQLVRERDRAWHIAADYDCDRNGGQSCWRDGTSSNDFTVGIEHAGFASQSSFPSGQIEASAELACDISRDHDIPRDRFHFVGHGELQPWNRTDPGANWPWSDYLDRIRGDCGTNAIIVDSNNINNDESRARIEVSGDWVPSDSTSGYYGTGYYYTGTKSVSDPATFWFYLPEGGTRTVSAWWTAGTNRSARAPFIAYDANGERLGTVYRDQRERGEQWVEIGSWNFTRGWNRVQLSRWAPEGDVVIADAIRVE